MDQNLTSPEFLDKDAEHRKKIREERYAAQRVGGAASHSAPSSSRPSIGLLEEILQVINSARANPATFANGLNSNRRPHFKDHELHLPKADEILSMHHIAENLLLTTLVTSEGAAAVEDAIRALRSTAPSGGLSYSATLAQAAQAAADTAGMQAVPHVFSILMSSARTNSQSADALVDAKKLGRSGKLGLSQLVQFGNASAEEFVARMIVDDGDSSRAGRATVLDPAAKIAGFGTARHREFGHVVVLLFTDSFSTN